MNRHPAKRARLLISVLSLCAVAALGQPVSILLHGWQTQHGGIEARDGLTATPAADAGAAHDASGCALCRSAAQSRYSLTTGAAAAAAPVVPDLALAFAEQRAPREAASSPTSPRAPPALS